MRKVNKILEVGKGWLNRPEKPKSKCAWEHDRELQQEAKNSSPEALELETLVTSGGRDAVGLEILGLVENLYKKHLNVRSRTPKPYTEKKLSLPIQAEDRRFIVWICWHKDPTGRVQVTAGDWVKHNTENWGVSEKSSVLKVRVPPF